MANALQLLKLFIWIYVVYLIPCHSSDDFAHNNVIFTNQPCPEGQEGVFYAVDHSPSQYKHCGPAGFFWIFPCSPGTYFSQMEQACVLPPNATTTSNIQTTVKSTLSLVTTARTTPVAQVIHTQTQSLPSTSTPSSTTLSSIIYPKQATTTVQSSIAPPLTTRAPTTTEGTTTTIKQKVWTESVFPPLTHLPPFVVNHQDTTSTPNIDFDRDEDNINVDHDESTTTALPFSAVEPKIFATVGPHSEHEEEYQEYELDLEHSQPTKDQHNSHSVTITVTAATAKPQHKTEDVEYWNENTAESPPIPLHPNEKGSSSSSLDQQKPPEPQSSPMPEHARDPDTHFPDYESAQPSFIPLENQKPTNNSTAKVKENYEYYYIPPTPQTVTPDYSHAELPNSNHETSVTSAVYVQPSILTDQAEKHELEGVETSQSLISHARPAPPTNPESATETAGQDHLWSEYESHLQVRPPQYETNEPVHQSTDSPPSHSGGDYSVPQPEAQPSQEMHYVGQQPEYPQDIAYVKTIDPELPNPAYEIKHNEEQQPAGAHYYINHFESTENVLPRTPSSKALPKSAATLSPQAQELAKKISEQDLESMRRVFETIASAAAQGGQGGTFLPPAFQLPPNVLNNQFVNGQPNPEYAQFAMSGGGFMPFPPAPTTEPPPLIYMVSECKENGTCEFNAIAETYCLHESNPTFYYQCGPSADDTGIWMSRQCPAGLHFNDDGQCGKKRKINTEDNNSEKGGQINSQKTPPPATAGPPDYYQPNQHSMLNTVVPPRQQLVNNINNNNNNNNNNNRQEEMSYAIAQPVQLPVQTKQGSNMPVEYPSIPPTPYVPVGGNFENRINNPKPVINSYQQIVQRPNYPMPTERRIISPANSFLQFPEQTNYAGEESINRPSSSVRPTNPHGLAKWVVDQQPTKAPLIPSSSYPRLPPPHQPMQTIRGGFLPDAVVAKLANLDTMAQAIAAKNVYGRGGQSKILANQDGYAVKPASPPVPISAGQNLFATYGTNYLLAGHPVTYVPNPYHHNNQMALIASSRSSMNTYDPNSHTGALPSYANNQKTLLIPRHPFPRPQIASRDEAAIIWQSRGGGGGGGGGGGDSDKSPEGINVWRPTPGQRCSLLASPRAQVFSNPNDYKSFYMCMPRQGGDDSHTDSSAEGSWALLQCPEDTVFNASLKVCDRSYTDFKQKRLTN